MSNIAAHRSKGEFNGVKREPLDSSDNNALETRKGQGSRAQDISSKKKTEEPKAKELLEREVEVVTGKIMEEESRSPKDRALIAQYHRERAELRYQLGKDKYAFQDLEASQRLDPTKMNAANQIMLKHKEQKMQKGCCRCDLL